MSITSSDRELDAGNRLPQPATRDGIPVQRSSTSATTSTFSGPQLSKRISRDFSSTQESSSSDSPTRSSVVEKRWNWRDWWSRRTEGPRRYIADRSPAFPKAAVVLLGSVGSVLLLQTLMFSKGVEEGDPCVVDMISVDVDPCPDAKVILWNFPSSLNSFCVSFDRRHFMHSSETGYAATQRV